MFRKYPEIGRHLLSGALGLREASACAISASFQRCSRRGDQLCAPGFSSVPSVGQLAFLTKQALPESPAAALFLSSNTHIHSNLFKRRLKPEGDESHPMC